MRLAKLEAMEHGELDWDDDDVDDDVDEEELLDVDEEVLLDVDEEELLDVEEEEGLFLHTLTWFGSVSCRLGVLLLA
mgnify:CR=1 FL=1